MPYQREAAIIILVAAIALFILQTIDKNSNPCVIRVTGESVTVTGCTLTPELIASIANLRPYNFGLGFSTLD
jgi:hypothetical protein